MNLVATAPLSCIKALIRQGDQCIDRTVGFSKRGAAEAGGRAQLAPGCVDGQIGYSGAHLLGEVQSLIEVEPWQ